MATINYYDVLGAKPSDTKDAIKKIYRGLAKKYHPDLNPGDSVAANKMREISEAWETLGDDEKRKKHDIALDGDSKKKPFTASTSKAPTSNRPITQEDFMNMSRNFDSMLSRDAIKNSVRNSKSSSSNQVNQADFFEQVIGFSGAKKTNK